MKKLIATHSAAVFAVQGDPFTTLARCGGAADLSQGSRVGLVRFQVLTGTVSPQAVLLLKSEDMRQAGLSTRKVEYLTDLSQRFAAGQLSVDARAWHARRGHHPRVDDHPGRGRWTAEMFLIFHLMRPNVLPLDDVGLINGISRTYYSGEPVSRSEVRELASAWSPFATVGTLVYLALTGTAAREPLSRIPKVCPCVGVLQSSLLCPLSCQEFSFWPKTYLDF